MKPQNKARRADYRYFEAISTRWKDNDLYGHVNNVEYYSFFDTVINKWLIEQGGLDIHDGTVIGVCAESSCRFFQSIAFPAAIEAGLRVAHLGKSSVRYEIGLFSKESNNSKAPLKSPDSEYSEHSESSDDAIAEGSFVHVFVSRKTRKPEPIPEFLRHALLAIHAPREIEK